MGQASSEDGSLKFIQPAVYPALGMLIARGLAAVAETLDPRRNRCIIGDDGASVTQRAEILGRVEAEGARDADGSDGTCFTRRQMRLGGIFDQMHAVPFRDRLERTHLSRLAIEVHRHDRARYGDRSRLQRVRDPA
jgi:hypothetical protein